MNGNKKSEINLTLDKAHDYFIKVNYSQEATTPGINFDVANTTENEEINVPVTLEEIRKAVKTLKNNKSSGVDMILNEHKMYSLDLPHMQQLNVKLLNFVFDTGIVPEALSLGKQKGEINGPSNYSPITLLSCVGRLFTR